MRFHQGGGVEFKVLQLNVCEVGSLDDGPGFLGEFTAVRHQSPERVDDPLHCA